MDPSNFKISITSVFDKQDKWFVNLSNSIIPEEVQSLLQLGENFCLPNINKQKTTIDLIKKVEHNISRLPANIRLTIRNRSLQIINKFSHSNIRKSPVNKILINASTITKNFMQDNPNIIFSRADKGNVTVAMDKNTYLSKMLDLFKDSNTYLPIKKDPTRRLIGDLHCLLARWKNNNYISSARYRRLNCTDGVLPRAYGLPKIHKPDCPLHVIVSSSNTPLYFFAQF